MKRHAGKRLTFLYLVEYSTDISSVRIRIKVNVYLSRNLRLWSISYTNGCGQLYVVLLSRTTKIIT
jgi:hypothetical protein